jgi:peptidoglycan hydrolase CwlO-like protein
MRKLYLFFLFVVTGQSFAQTDISNNILNSSAQTQTDEQYHITTLKPNAKNDIKVIDAHQYIENPS